MDLVTGALPNVLSKLGDLLLAEYNLQRGVKNGIKYLQEELEAMEAALEHISKVPVDKLNDGDKVWSRNVRDLSYDIEDSIDTFIVDCNGEKKADQHWFISMVLDKLMQPIIRHKFATELRDIKSRVMEISERRKRYKIDADVPEPGRIDPRLWAQHAQLAALVGINEARDELIQLLMQPGKIVSIVGFGGLGKTTLANLVYQELKAQFDCSAFVSVSQTPDMKTLLKDIIHQLPMTTNSDLSDASMDVIINKLKEFLLNKRYFIVIDDIWEIKHWNTIKCALAPDLNHFGCKIITTTRILNIAEEIGGAYNMRPLSLVNSRKLLNKRIFGNEDEDVSADLEVTEVLNKILKKCDGVPLAIITIASLLAIKGRNKWYEVYNSIGTGMENSFDVENMKKILLLSYYALPSYLRTCLLYLSFFPEDYAVDKDDLIWMWIAEGFIKCEKKGNLYEVGESYLNEITNRSMIQLVYNEYNELPYCRVHDMVLEVIRSLSSEENFIVVDDVDHTSPMAKVRRLSLQNGMINHSKPNATQQVRSVVVFPFAANVMPPLKNFRVLRVLNLQGCDLSQGYSLEYLGKLHHLRYLGLRNTNITQLPEEIGNLLLLQTLDFECVSINGTFGWRPTNSLPLTILRLRHLMRLLIGSYTSLPIGIIGLKSLEVLSDMRIEDSNKNIIKELGDLTELRVLVVNICIELDQTLNDCLVESLQKLQKIQRLSIHGSSSGCNLDGLAVASLHLRILKFEYFWFSTLPAWIDHLKLVDLCDLDIRVRRLEPGGLKNLGKLPALRRLKLQAVEIVGGFVTAAGWFPCLLVCWVSRDAGYAVFPEGVMPLLKELRIQLKVQVVGNFASINDSGLVVNIPSLQDITVYLDVGGAVKEDVEYAVAALKHAAEIHLNRPRLDILKGENGTYPIDTSSEEDIPSDEDQGESVEGEDTCSDEEIRSGEDQGEWIHGEDTCSDEDIPSDEDQGRLPGEEIERVPVGNISGDEGIPAEEGIPSGEDISSAFMSCNLEAPASSSGGGRKKFQVRRTQSGRAFCRPAARRALTDR